MKNVFNRINNYRKSPFSGQKLWLKIELGEAAKSGDVFAPWLAAGK